AEVRPEPLEVAVMGPLAEEVEVEVGQDRPELVRVDKLPAVPLLVLDGEAVREGGRTLGEDPFEEAVGMDPLHRDLRPRLARPPPGRRPRPRAPRAGMPSPRGFSSRRSSARGDRGRETGPSDRRERSG